MKICVAQTIPVKGDVERNIRNHLRLVQLAVSRHASLIIFPELSLTGYEPELARDLATTSGDQRLDPFQLISDEHEIIIGVGLPTKGATGIAISMIIFRPRLPRETYSKNWLHADEEPYFVRASCFTGLLGGEAHIALAICYELSVREHALQAVEKGANVYIASVSKTVGGIAKALDRLSEIAGSYSMTVMLSNQAGLAEGQVCAGRSSAWNKRGELVEQLDEVQEGILVIDLDTQEVVKRYVTSSEK